MHYVHLNDFSFMDPPMSSNAKSKSTKLAILLACAVPLFPLNLSGHALLGAKMLALYALRITSHVSIMCHAL